MSADTRIAVVVFLFYLLNIGFSFASNRIFLPPVFMEAYLLGGVALVYFFMSIKNIASIIFAAITFFFFYSVYSPVLPNTTPTTLQQICSFIPLMLPMALYAGIIYSFNQLSSKGKAAWVIHFLLFMISLWPLFFINGAIISLWARVAQSVTGIFLLSYEESGLHTRPVRKKIILLMMLIVFFDVNNYLYYLSLPDVSRGGNVF